MALVVMRHGAAAAAFERQTWLGAVERLDLALFVHRQHHGMSRRVDVEADDVAQLGRKVGIVGQLELTQPMRMQPVRSPNALRRADADSDRLGHRRRGPVRRLSRRWAERERHHVLGDLRRQRRDARGARLVAQQAVTPSCMKRSCQRHTAGSATRASRMISAVPRPSAASRTIRARQTCFLGLLRSVDGDKTLAIGGRDFDGDTSAHAPESHAHPSRGNPKRTQPSGFIH